MKRRHALALLLAGGVVGCVLGFYQTTTASPPVAMPFAISTEQRIEVIQELKEIKELLKEQNALLRSGDVKVMVQLPKAVDKAETPGEGESGN
jgi:hypothetical protein